MKVHELGCKLMSTTFHSTEVMVCISLGALVILPKFPLSLTGFFPGKHLIQFLAYKMQDFRNFVLHNCILYFNTEQVYLKLQVTNVKNKEVTANPICQNHRKN